MAIIAVQQEGSMNISIENQYLTESIHIQNMVLNVKLLDPAYVRADMIIVQSSNREIGAVFSEGYHRLGILPENVSLEAISGLREAFLSALRGDGSLFRLSAPLSVH